MRIAIHSMVPRAAAVIAALLVAGLGNPARAAAQQPAAEAAPRVIRVAGTGEVRTAPDQAHIDLAVETFAPTAQAAGEENARLMERVVQALVRAGVPRTEIQTRGYSLYPEYAQPDPPRPMPRGEPAPQPDRPRIVGYRATNTVVVRTQDLARVGALIDTALGAGANRMDGLRFSLRDAEAAQNEAARQATQRARRTAESIAAALGVQLGQVLEANTATGAAPMPVFARDSRMMMEAGAPPTPIQPGEQTVTATVMVVFAIRGG